MKAEREASIKTYREQFADQAEQIEKGKEERKQRYVPKKPKVEEEEEIIEVQIDYPSLTPDSDEVFVNSAVSVGIVGIVGGADTTKADIVATAPVVGGANNSGIVAIAGIAGIAGLPLLTR